MFNLATSVSIFLCLALASVGTLIAHRWLPDDHRDDATNAIVRAVAASFIPLTALVLGLLINSSKNAFDALDHNLHSFSAQIIQLDRTLRSYGPETAEARGALAGYVVRAIEDDWPAEDGVQKIEDEEAERLLDKTGAAIRALRPANDNQADLKAEARQRLQKTIELRWDIISHWDGALPPQLLVILVAWLSLIFASFGYKAPLNATIVATLLLAAFLVTGALHLIIDMESPFSGTIRVSPEPLQTALTHIRQP
jgi:hypothetical protein